MWVIMCVSWLYLCFIDYLINFHYYPASPRYSSAKVKITSWHTIQENCSSENIFLILERKEKMTNIRGEVETLSAWRVVWDEEYICSNSDNKWLEIWSNSFVQKDTAGQKKIRIPFDSSYVSLLYTLGFESPWSLRHKKSNLPDICSQHHWRQPLSWLSQNHFYIWVGSGHCHWLSDYYCDERWEMGVWVLAKSVLSPSPEPGEGDRESQSGAWSAPEPGLGLQAGQLSSLHSWFLDSG